MSNTEPTGAVPAPATSALPAVRQVTFADLSTALSKGIADFKAAPQFGLFFGAVYAVGGLILFSAVMFLGLQWLAYPLVIGFALIGPFVATGLYEVSRLREQGRELSWNAILTVVWNQRRRELGWMAFVMLFIFWIWMYQARTLFAVFFGFSGFATMGGFLSAVFTTLLGCDDSVCNSFDTFSASDTERIFLLCALVLFFLRFWFFRRRRLSDGPSPGRLSPIL